MELTCVRTGRPYYKNEQTGLCSFSKPEGGYRTGVKSSIPTRSPAGTYPARASYEETSSNYSSAQTQPSAPSYAPSNSYPSNSYTSAPARPAETVPLSRAVAPPPSSLAARTPTGPHVAILYYSMYGHIRKMALSVKKGLEAGGCRVSLLQVPETLPAEVLAKMQAPPKADDPIAEVSKLPEYDGIMFGIPGRFGILPAQMKTFWDSTGQLWMAGKLVGKPAGVFVSTGTQGGGQETIGFTFVSQLAHHGMNFVSLGYRDPRVFDYSEAHGASPYGAGCLAGPDGSRQPSELELGVAETQGKSFAEIVKKLAK